ncbi:hypothetical protein [Nonomuraea basaltis]|uniref:hypothetical protein n=1 Tax=Nonomuraea basaltis TaxID=2495887 RepID=UPI00110C5E8A|nr:hypothetical protein [Nonomuraea basaltis]TMR92583.1 hypothetical protein EJK15_44075 [Nonomuraea basaltis]
MTGSRQGARSTHEVLDEASEDFSRYVERTLLADVERYVNRVFLSRAELDDLAGWNPTGLAPLLREIGLFDVQLVIATHLRTLRARSRRHVPPALLPTLTSQETPWPRTTC